MTSDDLEDYASIIANMKRRLDEAYAAAERVHHVRQNPDADGWPLDVYKNLALQAADVNEDGYLRMWLSGCFSR